MFRIANRNAPHNLYADTELVREYIDVRGYLFNQDVRPLYRFGNDQTNWLDGAGRVTVKYSEFTTVIWKQDGEQYSRFIVDGYSPTKDAEAHNFITIDGYTDILNTSTIVIIQGPLYNDEATTLPSVLTVGVGPLTIISNGKYIQGTWRRNDIADPFEFYDNDTNKISQLKNGKIPIYEPGLEELVLKNYKNKRLNFSTNLKESVEKSDIVFICVGTPTKKGGSGADLSQIYLSLKHI